MSFEDCTKSIKLTSKLKTTQTKVRKDVKWQTEGRWERQGELSGKIVNSDYTAIKIIINLIISGCSSKLE